MAKPIFNTMTIFFSCSIKLHFSSVDQPEVLCPWPPENILEELLNKLLFH